MEETKALLQEKHYQKSLVGLFSKYDKFSLERMVGTHESKRIMKDEVKDSFHYMS